jgi:hypothetical protein
MGVEGLLKHRSIVIFLLLDNERICHGFKLLKDVVCIKAQYHAGKTLVYSAWY